MGESTPGSEGFDDNHMDDAEREGFGWTLNCRKRHHLSGGSASSQDTIIDAHRENRTVIVKPQDPTKLIAKFNPLTLYQELDSVTPHEVIQIRPNYRLNLLKIDMRNNSSMQTILTLTILLEIKVQTYEAHPRSSAVGIIRDVDKDITESDFKKALSATTPVILGEDLVDRSVTGQPSRRDKVWRRGREAHYTCQSGCNCSQRRQGYHKSQRGKENGTSWCQRLAACVAVPRTVQFLPR
ncbi:hypothetical protein ISCGN_004586 [Ixodes scapularis]